MNMQEFIMKCSTIKGGSMKKLLFIGLTSFVLMGCPEGSDYELVGARGRRPFYHNTPYGMMYIPSGGYNMGASDQDVPWAHYNRTKTVSVQAFFMDNTEITNNEYRQFVYYVRDSTARRLLAQTEPAEWTYPTYDDNGEERPDPDWNIDWGIKFRYYDPDLMPTLSQMYFPDHEKFYWQRQFDPRKLIFSYMWFDWLAAADKGRLVIREDGFNDPNFDHRNLYPEDTSGNGDPVGRDLNLSNENNRKGQNHAIRSHTDRSRFIIRDKIHVYPDTLCWIHDFTYSFNDPMTRNYFWHEAYDEYPVVGVTWQQARAFCVWRTMLMNTYLASNGEPIVEEFRLPSEAEWEYAARGGLDGSPYPWGGPYIRNIHGCILGNFKPMRGRYMEDGGFHAVKANSYHPNDYGLYCMAGNVAEWCETAYDESVYEFSHDLNPEYRYNALDTDMPAQKRKVIRGGSWKDISYYLQTGTRCYEYQDTAKSYIGYRCVMTYMGRGGPDQDGDGGTYFR